MRPRIRRTIGTAVAGLALAGMLTSCGSKSKTDAAGSAGGAGSGKVLTIGYSAWPGWFPLAVAEQTKQFEKAGLNVKLVYFADYTASLDALVAGKVDVNAQTLNDTLFGVAAGAKQKVVVVNDNSTGNDAVICDKSIKTVADLKGKSIAAEAGVVDQFLLLQGLAKEKFTDKDISFKGVKTDAAAAGFAGGQFDCAAVFAPFTVQALKRPGSHVLFSSKEFPGVIPDHLVATQAAFDDRPGDLQKLVNAWYATLDHIKADPAGSTAIMAKKAGLSTKDYDSLAAGTTIFDPTKAMDAFADRTGDPTSLPEMARRINPFLVSSGLTKKEAPLDGLFAPEFTSAYLKAHKAGG
ncbi:MAG: Aliphatic sulfonates transporter substrate-binding protein [Acidimicrobiales bacterium]|nr:Aliphatic sulfonates transporter substrate-binding protein [Acidimicrobiales bacterium]